MAAVLNPLDYRPEDAAFNADPFPLYRRMRDEDPCHWSPRLKAWVLTRYDDVRRACLDAGMSSDRLRPFFASMPTPEQERIRDIIRYLSAWMVFRDPPDHTRLRKLTASVFNVKSMHAMRPDVEEIADWLLQRIGERTQVDFIADFAGPLPALVIMRMLGVPREDLEKVKTLSDRMALFIGSSRANPEKYDIAEAATHEMAEFFRAMIAARRTQPRADLLSQLVNLRDETEGQLSEDELIATCILLLFAGHETTTNHIGNGLVALLGFPGEMARLRADPGLAAAAVEELLRYEGPSGAQVRVVAQATELHGKTLRAGDRVFLLLNAANRDERAYPDPDRLDLSRDGVPHLAFGFGTHICLGFPLARLEGQIAFPRVLDRFRRIEPAWTRLNWFDSMVFRGVSTLPIEVAR
ncbi:MAG: cytochrome P450 [Burkholderiales bacterium]|nr:cytochrome P450 [Burkholderiales bacterium]